MKIQDYNYIGWLATVIGVCKLGLYTPPTKKSFIT